MSTESEIAQANKLGVFEDHSTFKTALKHSLILGNVKVAVTIFEGKSYIHIDNLQKKTEEADQISTKKRKFNNEEKGM